MLDGVGDPSVVLEAAAKALGADSDALEVVRPLVKVHGAMTVVVCVADSPSVARLVGDGSGHWEAEAVEGGYGGVQMVAAEQWGRPGLLPDDAAAALAASWEAWDGRPAGEPFLLADSVETAPDGSVLATVAGYVLGEHDIPRLEPAEAAWDPATGAWSFDAS